MAVVINRYDFQGLPAGGGDPVATVSITPPSFQAGQVTVDAFLLNIREFLLAQQNVATVRVTRVETVTTEV